MNLRDENGQAIVIGALCIALLLGFVSLAVEVGMLFAVQQGLQNAADSAAITGVQELNYGDATAAAQADAARNGFTNDADGVTVTVNSPPASGPNAGTSGFVEVIISKEQPVWFMSLFGHNSMTVSARSVSTLANTNNCIYTLNTSGTDLTFNNGAQLDMPDCNIYGESTDPADFSASGGAHVKAGAINLVGGASISGGAHVSPSSPTTGVTALSDPLGYLSPPSFSPSSCQSDPNPGWKGGTFGPSAPGGTICYNGFTVSNGGSVTFNPGTYIINGTLTFSGGAKVAGTGVTFYLPPGASLSIGNGSDFSLSAPTSGTYNGILFYQDRSNKTSESLVGGSKSYLEGILYFPDANLTLNNGSNSTCYETIVTASLTMQGGAKLQNYALKNKSTPISSAHLVE
ncbi:MAG: pilus assembly protein TadG-related protein [Acidobacteriota bacterium]